MILCCKCGIPVEDKPLNMCDRCATLEVSLPPINTHMNIEHCRQCERYLNPPKIWAEYQWGSREFLIYLVKRNKSINNLEVVDCDFIYTEEHSKRIRIRLVVHYEGTNQEVEILFIKKNRQCPDCQKVEAQQFWNALVQVRHREKHKRVFMLVEQQILKNNAYRETSNIKQRKEGLDFYFTRRTDATRLVSFLQTVLPVRVIQSERLISKDIKSNKSNYKFTYSVEIVPLCTDDLVLLDTSVSRSLGVGSIALVKKMASTILFLDPILLKSFKMTSSVFWANKDKISRVMTSKDLKEFDVIEKGKSMCKREGYSVVQATVSEVTQGATTGVIECNTHLGYDIQEDDRVLGYDLRSFNSNLKTEEMGDVILVRKQPKMTRKFKGEDIDREDYLFAEDMEGDKEILSNICEEEEDDICKAVGGLRG